MAYLSKPRISLKKRLQSSHKGQNGKVLIVAGSLEFPGAASLSALAAMASLRSGSDLVWLAAPEKVAWAVNCTCPDIITLKLPGRVISKRHYPLLKKQANVVDSILLGPGLGPANASALLPLLPYLFRIKKPIVLDAELLRQARLFRGSSLLASNTILTPHVSELRSLMKNNRFISGAYDSPAILRRSMSPFLKQRNVVLLKGHRDIVVSQNRSFVGRPGSPGMTVGGTGDVLAGLCAGLLSQGVSCFSAACAASYCNRRSGKLLEKQMGFGFIASDILRLLPSVLKELY